MKSPRFTIAVIAIAAMTVASPMWAMAQSAPDPHHPSDGSAPAPDAQVPAPASPPGMMGMDMMRMMQMMHQGNPAMSGMSMQAMDMSGMPMTDHIEGRIAFLKAELKITNTQADAWEAFADALRLQAKRIAEARKAIGESSAQSAGFEQQLANQEIVLSARLEGIRAIEAAYGHLALSAEQRKIAEELLGAHMGMMRGPMMMAPMHAMPMGGNTP